MRYCGRCWKERKGWLPDRPKPKHKKSSRSREANGSTGGSSSRNKNKRTAGQAVKSSAGKDIKLCRVKVQLTIYSLGPKLVPKVL